MAISRFLKSERGNIALLFALVAPVLLGAVGAGVDYWQSFNQRAELQEIADAAAIEGAKEFILRNSKTLPEAVALGRANALLGLEPRRNSRKDKKREPEADEPRVEAQANRADREVTVSIRRTLSSTLFVGLFSGPIEISVTSTARSYQSANLCVLVLDTNKPEALSVKDSATLSGTACSVHVNSKDPDGLAVVDNAKIVATTISAVGGAKGPNENFTPTPITDYPVRPDPLLSRMGPATSGCDQTDLVLSDHTGSLSPGVYCGGLTIKGASDVTFRPGVYVIKDGPLVVDDTASVFGDRVGFYFTGVSATFHFLAKAKVDFSGPETGAMAGLLMFQDPSSPPGQVFEIKSDHVDRLVGTIYLVTGDLLVFTTSAVAEASAYTAILVDELWLEGSANLVLNSDYEATEVPLPSGFDGPGVVALRR